MRSSLQVIYKSCMESAHNKGDQAKKSMGTTATKPVATLSKVELAGWLSELGTADHPYGGGAVIVYGIDGGLICDLSQQEFDEALQDLWITNRLHQRVLTR